MDRFVDLSVHVLHARIRASMTGAVSEGATARLGSSSTVTLFHRCECVGDSLRQDPPTGRRARDAEIRGDGHVPGTLDETPKPVVVAALRASRGRHGADHLALPYATQLREDG